MTVKEWRNKHRKCCWCKHLRHMTLPPNCDGNDAWCMAKMKIVNEDLPRPFCELFEVKED